MTCAAPEDWVATLSTHGPPRDDALRRLHAILLRVARAEASRRAYTLRVTGPELDDIAHQAADDALLAITDRLHRFRGESRFTTWAHRFVVYEVGLKVNRHRWHREGVGYDDAHWNRLPDHPGHRPEEEAEWGELVAGVRAAVSTTLTVRQRDVFLALVVDGVPVEELSARLGTNRNAVYQVMFGARRKIRAALVAEGLVAETLVAEGLVAEGLVAEGTGAGVDGRRPAAARAAS